MIGAIADSLKSIIRHGLSLEAACRKCGRKAIVDPRYIARLVDPATSIHKLPLRCIRCKAPRPSVSAYPPDWE